MAKQTFQIGIDFIANVSDLQSKIKNVTGDIAKMGSTSGGSQIQKQFDQLTRTVENLRTRTQQPISSQADFNKLAGDVSRAEMAYDNLIGSVERLKGLASGKKLELLDSAQQKRISDATDAIKAYENATAGVAQKQRDLERAQERVAQQKNKIAGLKTAQQEAAVAVQRHKDKLTLLEVSQEDVINAEKRLQQAVNQGAGEEVIAKLTLNLQQAKTQAEELGVKFTKNGSATQAFSSAIERTNKDIDKLSQSAQNLALAKDLGTATAELDRLQQELQQLQGENPTAQLQSAFEQLKAKAQALGVSIKGIDDVSSIDQLKERLLRLKQQGLDQVDSKIDKIAASMNGDLRPALNNVRSGLNSATTGFQQFNRQAQEVEQLKSQLGYFFSLTNSVYLLRSALQSAFETVKELDKVMTETAVVTDFSVGDMWDRLPEYAEAASNLGSSIKDVYSATTLYYQQGLKTQAAMTVGIETMKMARIAGMDAAEATQAMTAALRGFNMEVNETNAEKVNDVYSNLAAITAADTAQIATAMSKTASIAASANMEFETTAALLAQIIETTQEAPETAGTAMKTIIARFAEVKSLREQGLASGQDDEGEIIDVNKIQTALRSVGISMEGFFSGKEGLHSVLLELAEKWNTLDFETQRYIATMAAGSRQQSRFIAMMSDYSRTTELVSAANNSAGASQKQFNKTMESLDAKLNKLRVAWDQFTMGIADNDLIKTGIDLLTSLLETINKLLNNLPGLVKSFASLALVFVALRVGGALLNKALSGISGIVAKSFVSAGVVASKTAEVAGQTAGTQMALGTAKGINNPAAQAALFKSYNALIFKIRSVLPPVTLKTALAPGSSAAVKSLWAEVNRLKLEEKQVAATYGKMSPQYQEIRKQRLLAAQAAQAARKANTTEMLSIEGTTVAISKEMAAKIKEGTITKTQLALLGPEAAARVSNALAAGAEEEEIEELVWAKTTEENLRKGGLSRFFTEIGLRVMNKTSAETESVAIWSVVKAKIAEAGAWIKANSAMLIGIGMVAVWVAAIAILVVGLIKLFKLGDREKGTTKRLEQLNSELAEVQDQISAVNEELSSLKDSRAGLRALQEEFKGLSRGSADWKEKLVEINSTVLDLMNKYPVLAQYVQRTTEGALDISESGWEILSNQMVHRKNVLTQTQSGIQLQKTEVQEQVSFEKAQTAYMQKKFNYEDSLKSEETASAAGWTGAGTGAIAGVAIGTSVGGLPGAIIGLIGGTILGMLSGLGIIEGLDWLNGSQEDLERRATGGLTADEFGNFASAAAEAGLSFSGGGTEEEFRVLYENMGFDKIAEFDSVYEKMKQMGREFDALANETLALKNAQKVYVDALITSVQQDNDFLSNHEFGEQAAEATAGIMEDLPEEIESVKASILEDKDYVKDGKATEQLIKEYADATGLSEDEIRAQIKDDALSADTMATTVATSRKSDEVEKNMTKTARELDILATAAKNGGKKINSLANALSDNGRKLTGADFKDIESVTGLTMEQILSIQDPEKQATIIDQYLAAYGTNADLLGVSPETLFSNWQQSYGIMSDAITRAQNIGVDTSEILGSNLSSETINTVLTKIADGATSFGSAENQTEVMSLIGQYAPENEEDRQRYYEILGETDWTDIDSVRNLSAQLFDERIVSEEAIEGINNLEESIIDLSNAAHSVTLDQAIGALESLRDISNSIRLGEQGSVFNKETYDQLIANFPEMASQFVRTGEDSFTYIGENLGEVADKLTWKADQKTVEILNAAEKDYDVAAGRQEKIDTTTGSVRVFQRGYNPKEYFTGRSEQFANVTDFSDLKEEENRAFQLHLQSKVPTSWLTSGDNALLELPEGTTFEGLYQARAIYAADHPGSALANQGWGNNVGATGYNFKLAVTNFGTNLNNSNANDVIGAMNQVVTGSKYNFGAADGYVLDSNWTSGISYSDIIAGLQNGTYGIEGNVSVGQGIISNTLLQQVFDAIATDSQKSEAAGDPQKMLKFIKAYTGPQGDLNAATAVLEENKEGYETQYATMESGQAVLDDKSHNQVEEEAKARGLDARVAGRDGEFLANQFAEDLGLEEADNLVKALTSDYIDSSKAIKNAGEVLGEYSSVLTKSKRGTVEYSQALKKVKPALESAFGKKISDKVLQEHADLIERIASGDLSAVAELRTELTKDTFEEFTEGVKGVETTYNEAVDAALNLANVSPEIGIASTYDPTGEFAAKMGLQSLSGEIEATSENLAYLQEFYTGLGYTMTYTTKTMYYDPKTNTLSETDDGGWKQVKIIDTITTVKNNDNDLVNGGNDPKGGGGSKWENKHDKLYNNYEEVNKLLRERERIERDYDRILKKHDVSGKKLLENQQQQLANLKLQREEQEKIQAGKADEIQDLLASKKGKKYAKYYSYDATTGEINIDWEEVNKLRGSKGEGFDDFLSELEGLRDQWVEAGEELESIDDTASDIYDQNREDYLSFEERIKDAVVQARQDEIDKLSEINESINDTNGRILDSMQEQIDEYRQNRDNEKTEQELSDKQRRLTYLQQDTSGANATEILKLQKEIEEGQESYTDQLIDQKISELQKQNDKAAEQRERQIQLMESQLEYDEKSGRIWDEVYRLWGEGIDAEGLLKPGSELEQVLRAADEAAGKSVLGEQQWKQELAGEVATAWAYVNGLARAREGQKVTFKTATGDELTGTADKHGNIVVDDYAYKGVSQDNQGTWSTKEATYSEPTEDQTLSSKGSGKIASLPAKLSKANVKTLQEGLNELLDDGVLSGYSRLAEDGDYGSKTKAAVKKLQKAIGVKDDGIWGKNTRAAFLNSALKAYASGGLADFTGPAWLDGTKSRPEYILSADQTKAFFTLVDVLSGLSAHKGDSTENNRESNYDIDINVESIGSDYDVEQLANKVKSLINEDARYRNNNVINLMR